MNSIMRTVLTTLAITASAGMAAVTVDATSGFNGWLESNTGDLSLSGRFLSGSGTGMDTGGSSWGLYANSGQTASNTYLFGSTLSVGESVSISVSLGFIDGGGTIGFGLQNSSGVNRFESYYIGGSTDAWKINDSGGQEDITGVATGFAATSWSNSNYADFEFHLLPSNVYSLSVNGTPITNADLGIAASDIDRIRIFNYNAGNNGSGGHDQFFNSLSVIPEPSTAWLSGLAALVLLRRRR